MAIASAVSSGRGGATGDEGWRRRRRDGARVDEDAARAVEIGPSTRTQEAVGAHFGKATRQDVREEAIEKVLDGERYPTGLTGPRMSVFESDLIVTHALDPLIGERDPIDVAREIECGVLPGPNGLDVDRPPPLPHARIDGRAQAGARQRRTHLRAKHRRHRVPGHQESGMRWLDPGRSIGRQPAGRDEQMHMRMVFERARPRVQHGQDARRAADPLPIVRQHLHRRRRFAEQRGVHDSRMPPRDRAQLARQREGEQIVITREEARLCPREPVLRAIVLTRRDSADSGTSGSGTSSRRRCRSGGRSRPWPRSDSRRCP